MRSRSLQCLFLSIFSYVFLLSAAQTPKVDELLADSGEKSVTVQSNKLKLTTEQNVYAVELTLPFSRCEKVKD